jgi:probable selenium-dependent hydroxylase accessory protein YqeC
MIDTNRSQSFLQALKIARNDVVCLVGAGGKTSLMFRLAEEAKLRGYKVLVTTTTRILIPGLSQYDAIDLSGMLFSGAGAAIPGIYVGGQAGPEPKKMRGASIECLNRQLTNFDLILIEADGAAKKPLKGWNSTEPVVPRFTTKTIGIIDIQAIGQVINNALVHRLEIFLELTGAEQGEPVAMSHIHKIVTNENGIFQQAQGEKLLYINKVESGRDRCNVDILQNLLNNEKMVAGSVLEGVVFV